VLFQELGDKYIVATSLNGLGNVALDVGDYTQARARYEESLSLFRELGDRYGVAGSLLSMGEVSRCLEDYDASRPQFEESLAMWKALGEKWNLAMTLHNLGHVVHHQGSDAEARTIFTESLALFREVGARVGIAMCLAGIAGLDAEAHPDRAARLFGAAEALREAAGVPLQAADLDDHNRNVATARVRLDEPLFRAMWEEGRAMTMEQAIVYALAQAQEGRR
jgi:tetratricopeptide (TPR) repeat protein